MTFAILSPLEAQLEYLIFQSLKVRRDRTVAPSSYQPAFLQDTRDYAQLPPAAVSRVNHARVQISNLSDIALNS
jgi:hypothetical protein